MFGHRKFSKKKKKKKVLSLKQWGWWGCCNDTGKKTFFGTLIYALILWGQSNGGTTVLAKSFLSVFRFRTKISVHPKKQWYIFFSSRLNQLKVNTKRLFYYLSCKSSHSSLCLRYQEPPGLVECVATGPASMPAHAHVHHYQPLALALPWPLSIQNRNKRFQHEMLELELVVHVSVIVPQDWLSFCSFF